MSLAIWWGARVVKSPRAHLRRALGGALIVVGLHLGLLIMQSLIPAGASASVVESLITQLIPLGLLLLLATGVFYRMFSVSLGRAAAITGFLLGTELLLVPAVIFIVRPHLFEMLHSSTNSMAPTLLGWHHEGLCPKCGGRTVIPAPPPNWKDYPVTSPEDGICVHCQHVSKFTSPFGTVRSPDRFAVNKLASLERWDIAVFRPQRDPASRWHFRVVGMPGETVFIDEGGVWINGSRMSVPPSVPVKEYAPPPAFGFGKRTDPVRLGAEEFFLLGDYSMRAIDSRHSGPVSRQQIEGVVEWCYWPPSRMRFLRQ